MAKRRGSLRQIAPRVYTDDLTRSVVDIVRENLLAILGAAYPDWHVSHSTAATLKPIRDRAFLSGEKPTRRPIKLPGVRVERLPALPYPEVRTIELDQLVATGLTAEPRAATVRVSSPLQTVFECLTVDARQPERSLPETNIRALIEALSETDRLRAAAFAERNGLGSQLERFQRLAGDSRAGVAVKTVQPSALDVFFYHWPVGRLEELSNGEYRFRYDPGWRIPLNPQLPHRGEQVSYEGAGLPAFFENLLPEGWAEARLRATHKIAREDAFGLLETTPKYLSNLTLRPIDFDASGMVLDHVDVRFADVAPDSTRTLNVGDTIQEAPDTRELWLELRRRGATRLSGVQAKLPVHLGVDGDGQLQLSLGHLGNTTTHILKLQSPDFEALVQNEWATMELARRVGLRVADVRMVTFSDHSPLPSPALLVERFDLPTTISAPERIYLLEDAASILGIRREDKYTPSLERVADALQDVGLEPDDLWVFLDHVIFSWLTGNGDLHAKNISVLREIVSGTLGAAPAAGAIRYSPLYDLVNTRLALRDDHFALVLNGRDYRLRVRDFAVLAQRWSGSRGKVRQHIEKIAEGVTTHLDAVLGGSRMTAEHHERFASTVRANVDGVF